MAYILGCVIPVALAVGFVWVFGIVLGGILWVLTMGIGAAVLRWFKRRHLDPMLVYDAERRALNRSR